MSANVLREHLVDKRLLSDVPAEGVAAEEIEHLPIDADGYKLRGCSSKVGDRPGINASNRAPRSFRMTEKLRLRWAVPAAREPCCGG